MKSLVTGVKGQLGYDIVRELNKRGYTDILAVDYDAMDITNKEQVENVVKGYNPDVIFHCAAYTAVDKAEENIEACTKVNVDGTRNISEVAHEIGSKLIYISTDYVFDGTKTEPYEVNDETNPKSVYGLTKRQGEIEALKNFKTYVVRTSWVFGINGNNFVKTMLKQVGVRKELNVVNDQIGSPTYTVDLARVLVDMAEVEKYGIYHVNNEGFTSWYDFAVAIFKNTGNEDKIKVNAVTTEKYYENNTATVAYRPRYSALSKKCLDENGFKRLQYWEDALKEYINELNAKEKESVKTL
jgi:dTDP-4-dehydrorhamnose reductase